MTPIYRLAYLSDPRLHDPGTEIRALLTTAHRKNAACGVTGALMYTERNFIQLLEGPHLVVQKVMSVIERDPRHANVAILGTQNGQERRFAGRPMTLVGRSKPAAAFYHDYIAGRIRWNAMQLDSLVALMQKLIEIDDAATAKA